MQKLFYEDVHMVDFEAVVRECSLDDKTGNYKIVLDKTAFFPEEGGQSADKGTLSISQASDVQNASSADTLTVEVLDVQIKNDIIYHILSTSIPVGTAVAGHVDWAQRFDFMQQHTGEHIISGLIHSHFGYDNVGFHLGLTEVTMDMNGELSLEQLRVIEQKANEIVWRNLPVCISFPSSEELSTMDYRSKLDLTENVRIVEIPGVDMCACCAPHVDTTGQIGMIKITNVQSHRGGVRINILCGGRALADYTEKQDSVFRISALLSAKQPAVADAVVRLQEEISKQKERTNELQALLLESNMRTLPSPSETENVVLFVNDLDAIAMRNAVNSLTEKYNGYCGIFAGDDTNGYRFIIGSTHKDCRELANYLRQTFSAKGGGTAPMIQGSIQADKAAITDYLLH